MCVWRLLVFFSRLLSIFPTVEHSSDEGVTHDELIDEEQGNRRCHTDEDEFYKLRQLSVVEENENENSCSLQGPSMLRNQLANRLSNR